MLLSGVNSGYARVASNNNASKFTHNVVKVNPKKPSSLIDAIKHETAYDNLSDTEKTLVKPIVTEQDKEKFVDAFLKKSEELTQQARAKYRTSQDDIDNDLAEQHLANGNPEQAIELYQKVYDRAKKHGYLDTEEFVNLITTYKELNLNKNRCDLLHDFSKYTTFKFAKMPYKIKNDLFNDELQQIFYKNLKSPKIDIQKDFIIRNIEKNNKKIIINCNLLELRKFFEASKKEAGIIHTREELEEMQNMFDTIIKSPESLIRTFNEVLEESKK